MHLLRRQGTSIPVVLNLATWRPEFTTIEDWLLQILPAELATTSSLAEQIRKNIPLILLLDGLDELPEADRASCLTAIGEYGADAKHQFLISSRIDEYAATKDAPVNAQIEVAPLTIEQVELGLAATANIQPESKRLLNALKTDPLLRKAVENPFYLNTAQLLFASGKNWSEYEFAATDVAGREQELVERFIESALSRKVRQEFPADQSRHWLSFLASRMTERNMVVFELRDLQYDWWRWSKWQLGMVNIMIGLIQGLVIMFSLGLLLRLAFNSMGLLAYVIAGLIGIWVGIITGRKVGKKVASTVRLRAGGAVGLLVGSIAGVVCGILAGVFIVYLTVEIIIVLIIKPMFGLLYVLLYILAHWLLGIMSSTPLSIQTKDSIHWSWKLFIQNFKKSLSAALINAQIFVLIIGVLAGLVYLGLMFVELLVTRDVPSINSTSDQSIMVIIALGLLAGLLLGVIIAVFRGLVSTLQNYQSALQISTPYQRFTASAKNLHFSILQHLLLRYQFYKKGLIPLRLVDFLNELSDRRILETDGATWRFRHRILQEWFAERWVEEDGTQKEILKAN
jgi:hypothetical protein